MSHASSRVLYRILGSAWPNDRSQDSATLGSIRRSSGTPANIVPTPVLLMPLQRKVYRAWRMQLFHWRRGFLCLGIRFGGLTRIAMV